MGAVDVGTAWDVTFAVAITETEDGEDGEGIEVKELLFRKPDEDVRALEGATEVALDATCC